MARRKLHQWEKILTRYEDVVDANGVKHRLIQCKECIKCGLKQGYTKDFDSYGNIIYYEDNDMLSKDVLPYGCTVRGRVDSKLKKLKKQKNEMRNSFLLSEDDFNV
jgi:hypothetical protein